MGLLCRSFIAEFLRPIFLLGVLNFVFVYRFLLALTFQHTDNLIICNQVI